MEGKAGSVCHPMVSGMTQAGGGCRQRKLFSAGSKVTFFPLNEYRITDNFSFLCPDCILLNKIA